MIRLNTLMSLLLAFALCFTWGCDDDDSSSDETPTADMGAGGEGGAGEGGEGGAGEGGMGGEGGAGEGGMGGEGGGMEAGNLAEVATAAGNFTTLLAAVEAAGLTGAVTDPNANLTVFAPTDEAFAALGQETIDALLADPQTLAGILTYHVVTGVQNAEAVLAADSFTTLNGADIAISIEGDNAFVNDAQIIATDVMANNGVIHVIDKVLLPPAEGPGNIAEVAAEAGSFNTLLAAVDAAGLGAALTDPEATLTVFAPTDEAFAALGQETIDALLADPEGLGAILLYHVLGTIEPAANVVGAMSFTTLNGAEIMVRVEGDNVFINDAQVVMTDIEASNGIIHVIDSVLLPPAEGPGNIAEVAAAAGSFNTLLAAVEAAGLGGALTDPEATLTVFAPTDEAFAALGQETIDALLADPEGQGLAGILLYHVLGTIEPAASVVEAMSFETLNGANINVRIEGDNVFINDAQVVMTDIEASNGIIHVINAVLLPPTE